ncbi:hypothetical protein QFC21_004949 [Naganishia friedmannii]|uniref:Uncharacterized protein n=1 Tax=Naganishia friedmannii TaxID=89922 RepID=A0ACC2VDV0_9TREE|nr:hypothetical protein QFC21_004949 [Naganishia friedmannii]
MNTSPSSMDILLANFDAQYEQMYSAPTFAVGPPVVANAGMFPATNNVSPFLQQSPTLDTVGVNLAQIGPTRAANLRLVSFNDIDWEYPAPSPSLGRARAPVQEEDILPQHQSLLPPPARTTQFGPARVRASKAALGHPYARPSTAVAAQPEASVACAGIELANAVEPAVQGGRTITPRLKLRRCPSHAGTGNNISQSVVNKCADCTIYRNVSTYINLEPRAHVGNGNGGNDKTFARLIRERRSFLANMEKTDGRTKVLEVIGIEHYDYLMTTYERRGGAAYQPPSTYLRGR